MMLVGLSRTTCRTEKPSVLRVNLSATSQVLAGRLGAGPNLHAHALVLDALAGERVDRLG